MLAIIVLYRFFFVNFNTDYKKYKTMKKYFLFSCTILTSLLLTSCSAVETIFKAGMWWAFILIFLGIGLVIWIFSKMRNKD